MYTQKELNMIDRDYFFVIDVQDNTMILQSQNTLHGWHILKLDYVDIFLIYHRHENQTEYHKHGYAKTFQEAINQIKKHDNYQIYDRWKGFNYAKVARKVAKDYHHNKRVRLKRAMQHSSTLSQEKS